MYLSKWIEFIIWLPAKSHMFINLNTKKSIFSVFRHFFVLLKAKFIFFLNGAFKDINSYSILLYDDVRAVYNVSHYWCRSHDAYFILFIEQNSWLNIKLLKALLSQCIMLQCINNRFSWIWWLRLNHFFVRTKFVEEIS